MVWLQLLTADIEVDNGVIHAVDAVIGFPSVVTFAMADPTFAILVAALTREADFTFVNTLMETRSSALSLFSHQPIRLLDLLEELEVEALGDISADVLASTLSYHVVTAANVRSTDLSDDMDVNTLGRTVFHC